MIVEQEPNTNQFDNIRKALRTVFSSRKIPNTLVEKVTRKYGGNLEALAALEGKASIRPLRRHTEIEMLDYTFFSYNPMLTKMYLKARFNLHPLLLETHQTIAARRVAAEELFPVIFAQLSGLYRGQNGNNRGYLSFVSHVQGFFELSRKQGKNLSEEQFEAMYQEKKPVLTQSQDIYDSLVDSWFTYFQVFHKNCLEQMSNLLDNNYKHDLEKTIEELDKKFHNDFHQAFVRYAQKTKFMEDTQATAYRFVVNLLYLLRPFFNISALSKQKYIFMAYRLVEERRGGRN